MARETKTEAKIDVSSSVERGEVSSQSAQPSSTTHSATSYSSSLDRMADPVAEETANRFDSEDRESKKASNLAGVLSDLILGQEAINGTPLQFEEIPEESHTFEFDGSTGQVKAGFSMLKLFQALGLNVNLDETQAEHEVSKAETSSVTRSSQSKPRSFWDMEESSSTTSRSSDSQEDDDMPKMSQ